jgi:UDP-N-acetylmuramoyl-L-alanine---L-glutamate ligase
MIELFENYTRNKKVLIMGFGREGQSTYGFILRHFAGLQFAIADINQEVFKDFDFSGKTPQLFSGSNYQGSIADFDVIIKSPGVKLKADGNLLKDKILLSQTGLFLEHYGRQTIGITGTKGKSTTSSLIHHIMNKAGKKSFLVGNIGLPPFDIIDSMDASAHVVFELSANQLQFVNHSPHIAILLNLFEEHLDFFGNKHKYFSAKWNITAHQSPDDFFICNKFDDEIAQMLDDGGTKAQITDIRKENQMQWQLPAEILSYDDKTKSAWNGCLRGNHNLINISAAAQACRLAGVEKKVIEKAVRSFKPLAHRLEYIGNYCGIDFYNDSISTIPQSTIEALKTVSHTYTLILGGFDRGLDYSGLLNFLKESAVELVLFTGPAGKRMMHSFLSIKRNDQEVAFVESFDKLPQFISLTRPGGACLLSPAASSYNEFKDFAERGRAFKKIAENLTDFCH